MRLSSSNCGSINQCHNCPTSTFNRATRPVRALTNVCKLVQLRNCSIRDTTGLLLPPLGYLDFLRFTSQARLILTDSGSILEKPPS